LKRERTCTHPTCLQSSLFFTDVTDCKPASPTTQTPPTPTPPTPTPPTPTSPTPPTPASAVRFDTCGVTSYQSTTNAKTVSCFKASDCANYSPKFGTACCLADRCICGSDADASPCANFAPASATGSTTSRIPGVTVPTVTVPTVSVPAYSSP
jgi:hypothetical protein